MRGSIDVIVGIVSIGDLAEQITAGRKDLDLARCRDPYQVPATSPALSVLQRFQEDKHRFALVIDEYGGIDGLITTHDLMEALVGEIGDSEFATESTIVKREDGSFLVDASVDLEDMMERIGIRLPIERERKGFYSLGGLIMERLGNVPRTGERFSFGDIDFEVVDMDGYRIDKVLIKAKQLNLSNSVANSTEQRRSQAISQNTRHVIRDDSVHIRKKLKKVIG
jgi:putative hemolysin